MDLKKDIENHTLDELKELYKIPKTKIKRMLEEQGLEIKYCGRTPYTKQLIPTQDEYVSKYQNNKKRCKTNEFMMCDCEERQWPQCEINSRIKDIEDYDFRLGVLFNDINTLQKQINDIMKNKVNQQFMISIGRKTLETKDWCGYIEEEKYGKRPEVNKIDISTMTDDMVLGYLSHRLNPLVLSDLAKILMNKN